MRFALVPLFFLLACESGISPTTGSSDPDGHHAASDPAPANPPAPPEDTPVDRAAACTDTFGTALTADFGRIDGTLLAVVKPSDQQCPMPNSTHVILEITMSGAVYRLVVNVESEIGDPNTQFLAISHALPAPAYSEGWHTGLTLDYVADFGVTSNAFASVGIDELSEDIADATTLGQKISVYAQSSGGASAHEVHRNDGVADGAIVLDPDTTPHVLLFRFADQPAF